MFNNALVTRDWTVIAKTFNRTEAGGRGTFFEFEKEDVCISEIGIPKGAEWRLTKEWLAKEYLKPRLDQSVLLGTLMILLKQQISGERKEENNKNIKTRNITIS